MAHFVNEQGIMTFVDTDQNPPDPNLPFVERNAITAVLYNPKTDRYLGLKWLTVDWETLVTGGIEKGQTPEEAARAELLQETGYKNVRLVSTLPPYDSKFYHQQKEENRFAHFQCFFFELVDEEQEPIGDDDKKIHKPLWMTREEMESFRLPEGHRFVFNAAINPTF